MTTAVFLRDLSNTKAPPSFPLNRPLYIIMDTCPQLKCVRLITMKQLEIINGKMSD